MRLRECTRDVDAQLGRIARVVQETAARDGVLHASFEQDALTHIERFGGADTRVSQSWINDDLEQVSADRGRDGTQRRGGDTHLERIHGRARMRWTCGSNPRHDESSKPSYEWPSTQHQGTIMTRDTR